jgi:Zn-dependent protease with chaperone function
LLRSPGLLRRFNVFDRWRLILLSPEEEDQIAAQLAGQGWYQAVTEILASQAEDGEMPASIPATDWRYQWVQSTLRRLESIIPVLQDEANLNPSWLETGPDDVQLPPPAEFPLRPRPRASEYLKMISDMTCGKKLKHTPDHAPHAVTGPPYSLLLVDNPNASNAFSYGFGPNGGAGIVVYTAFVDEILNDPSLAPSKMSQDQPEETSWWSYIFGSILNTRYSQHPIPSPEQTNRLAVLLAHELSHLILSHHLESLTSSSIVLPGLLSILTDLIRTLMFPVTMLFGPFVNDAVANMGKIGSGEVTKLSVLCTTRVQELEADVVSTRILAYAGFNPHSTVEFWESRTPTVYGDLSECATWKEDSNNARSVEGDKLSYRNAFSLFGSTHPMHDTRVGALTRELLRWSAEKKEALAQLQEENQQEAQ